MRFLVGFFIILAQGMVSRGANLTAITWAHAVNSQAQLDETLVSRIDMIEADIVLGHLVSDPDGPAIPVMGHPPVNTSDISLQSFLTQILEYNRKNSQNMKGVKLDFKSIEVFTGSLAMLKDIWASMDYPVWLNADIISGPVNNTSTKPVDADSFLAGCSNFPEAVLSIGWTTRWGRDFIAGFYTAEQIDKMSESIRKNDIPSSNHPITFPVRAGIAAQSLPQLTMLMREFNRTNTVTLTIWSSENDHVDVQRLRSLIFAVGIDKVYVDVPEDLLRQLDLGNDPNGTTARTSFCSLGCLLLLSVALIVSHKYIL
ncbi:protein FAM151B [Sergentomyia squamirostris]